MTLSTRGTGGTARFLLSDLGSEMRGTNIPTPEFRHPRIPLCSCSPGWDA